MGRDTTFVNAGNKILNCNILAYYFAPKKEFNINKDSPNWMSMSPEEIVDSVDRTSQTNPIFTDPNTDEKTILGYCEEYGIPFYCADGTEDVYTKSGLENEEMEYLDRQFANKRKFRIKTDETYIDFKSGGIIVIGTEIYRMALVIKTIGSGTTHNKFNSMNTPIYFSNYANKIISLV